MIKKLIIPAAGQKIILLFSAIKELHIKNIWNINNINEISGTSAGAIIALLLALKIDLQIIEDYFIERPWNKFFPKFNELINNLFNSGIYDKSYCYKFFDPFFKLENLELDITFKQLYEINKIKINIYVTNLNDFVHEVFSYDNTPNLSIIDAIYMSSTLPFLCQPIKYNDKIYIDGGFFKYYPIDNIKSININETLIFAFKDIRNNIYTNDITTISLLLNIISQTINYFNDANQYIFIKNKVLILNEHFCYDIYSWFEFFNNKEIRKHNIKLGKTYANIFINKQKINNEIIKLS
jgi:NTE family protein